MAEDEARVALLMQDHEKHYRGLCHWIVAQRRRSPRLRSMSACGLMSEVLGTGHTVATAIWNKYKPAGEKDYA
jgi:hypothetical protein